MNSFCPLIKGNCRNDCMFYSGQNTYCNLTEILFELRKANEKKTNLLNNRSETGNGFIK